MATYKGIQGYTVQKLATDPTASAGAEGQLFYNSTTGKFKLAVAAAGSWASVASLLTPKSQASGIGTPTACIAVKGSEPAYTADSETFDGTSWTEGNNSNAASRNGKGTGTTTAAMTVGGWSSPGGVTATEYYDGTSWSIQSGTLSRGGGNQSFGIAGASQASAIIFGGEPGTTYWKSSETWDGTSWTEGNNLTTERQAPVGAGIVTAGLCIAGSPSTNKVEAYDGTCWSETSTDINTARVSLGGSGTSTLAVVYGGSPNLTVTESFDGTSWTEVGDLATGRYDGANAQAPGNTNTQAMWIGGQTPTIVDNVESYSDPVYSIKTVTVS